MVLLRPVHQGIQDVAGHHAALGGDLRAAAGAVGGAAVLILAEVIPGHRLEQAAFLQVIGMVVYHIHDDPQSIAVQGHDGFLQLADADLSVVGIAGVRAVGDVVIHRIITPVEGVRIASLVHRAVVIHRHELHMGGPQVLQVIQAGGAITLAVQGGVIERQGGKLPPELLRHAAVRVPGEILDVDLIDHVLHRLGRGRVLRPALGISRRQLYHHAPLAVDATGLGVRILGAVGRPLHRDIIIIIYAVQPGGIIIFPQAARALLHQHAAHGGALAAIRIQIQHDLPGCGRPQRKVGTLRIQPGSQGRVAVIFLLKFRRIKPAFELRRGLMYIHSLASNESAP